MLRFLMPVAIISLCNALECPKGFIQGGIGGAIRTKCFMFFNENANWTKAQERCEQIRALRWQLGNPGQLASVRDDGVNSVVELHGCSDSGISAYRRGFWIGASRGLVSETWSWIDGAPFVFSLWSKGLPYRFSF